jgi:hypothetical protein
LFPLAGFFQRTVAAGAGGAASPSTYVNSIYISALNQVIGQINIPIYRGGGGGGGVLISGVIPAQSAQAGTSEGISDPTTWHQEAWVTVGGDPGQGLGAGGGGGTRRRGDGGQGASGVVYIEWSP